MGDPRQSSFRDVYATEVPNGAYRNASRPQEETGLNGLTGGHSRSNPRSGTRLRSLRRAPMTMLLRSWRVTCLCGRFGAALGQDRVSRGGDPCSDGYFLPCFFASGAEMLRITKGLTPRNRFH